MEKPVVKMKSYTLTFVLGKTNKKGLAKIYLRYYSKEADIWLSEKSIHIKPADFQSDNVQAPVAKTNPNYKQFNTLLNNFRIAVEARIVSARVTITKELLLGYDVAEFEYISDFIDDIVQKHEAVNDNSNENTGRGKKRASSRLSEGRLKLYKVIRNKLTSFSPNAKFSDVSLLWIQKFEAFIAKSVSQNTLSTNMTVFKAILSKASEHGIIDDSAYKNYKIPKYEEEIPEYLDEKEIDAFFEVTKACAPGSTKTAGYYFLLACYTGYRISDLYAFNYSERVRGDKLVLRAKKNGVIVSIPLYPRLKEVLEYVKDNKINITEEHMRKKVKTIASLAGINGRNIKVHTARHSFAMLFIEKGFSIEEVAEMLGDSVQVARVYARITNKRLHNRVLEVMGGKESEN